MLQQAPARIEMAGAAGVEYAALQESVSRRSLQSVGKRGGSRNFRPRQIVLFFVASASPCFTAVDTDGLPYGWQ